MTDRKLIMHAVECCLRGNCNKHKDCAYSLADDCMGKLLEDVLKLLKEQEKRINELEEKLRLLQYGDQDILQSGMIPAT